MEKENAEIIIDTYHEYMQEAFDLISLAKQLQNEDDELVEKHGSEHDFSRPNEYLTARISRYAFLLSAMGLEAGANALIKSFAKTNQSYEEYEKVQTLLKYELFCISNKRNIDRGNAIYQNIKELVNCRNEFVHPKPRSAEFKTEGKKDYIINQKTSKRNYPKYLNFIMLEHAIQSVGDVANFTAWVLFDICSLPIKKGASLIGLNTYGWIAEQVEICTEYNFDQRSFGIE